MATPTEFIEAAIAATRWVVTSFPGTPRAETATGHLKALEAK